MLTEKQLFDLKEKIESAKNQEQQLQGQKTALLNSLKTDFKCKDVPEAQSKIESLESEAEDIINKITSLSEKIESELETE
jgi:FtsZ-binding cell division protein ZapB